MIVGVRESFFNMENTHIRRGFGIKDEIQDTLDQEYQSVLIEKIKANESEYIAGNTKIKLAKEYGFCYGVDRSIDYAYQTVKKFPDKKIYMTGEIIHNPYVNKRLIDMGVMFLSGQYNKGESVKDIQKEDIVILPAFGISVSSLAELKQVGCILVDTTCGSVLNVWKHVKRFSKDDYTALIHGKYYHEETIAIASQTDLLEKSSYIIVRNFEETERVCDYIRGKGDKNTFLDYFKRAVSEDFNPDQDLIKIGVANQTTMLANESLKIAGMVREALVDRYGPDVIDEHFRSFDTICSATQERQDAILELLDSGVDLTIVIGGYNSSNTNNLTNIAVRYGPAFHIEDASAIHDRERIQHKIPDGKEIETTTGWLPEGKLTIGITAGASTPDRKIEEVVNKVLQLRGK
jgi:4-hydroxy-3-methylbut-2-enyl diphosphate reductase